MIASRRVLLLGLAAVAAAGGWEPPAYAQGRGRPEAAAANRELHQQEMRVKRARRVTRRILNDRRASSQIKQRAADLDRVLDQREQTIASLEALHRSFLSQHQADIAELTELRRRAMEVDERLRAARNAVLAAHDAEIKELRDGSKRAEELIDQLSEAYGLDKRERRQRE